MRLFLRILTGALTVVLFASACNLPAGTPTAVGTILPTGEQTLETVTAAPSLPADTATPTTLIPVTGVQEVYLQCQFCVNAEPHAVLILPETASFLVSEPVIGVNCITAQVVGDRRILFCRGAQQTTFTFNVCFDDVSCLQYPVTLETCPLSAQAANPTPAALVPVDQGVTPTAPAETATSSPPATLEATTAAPLPSASPTAVTATSAATTVPPMPTQTAPPVISTATLPPAGTASPQGPQSRVPATRLPRTTLNTPEGFLRWYFAAVWTERNYQDLWENYLTPSFKSRPNAGGLEGYADWWSSVQRVDVNSVTVLENDGTHAWVRVNVTFTMNDGRVIANQEYDYDLLFDSARQTWMFDYRTPVP